MRRSAGRDSGAWARPRASSAVYVPRRSCLPFLLLDGVDAWRRLHHQRGVTGNMPTAFQLRRCRTLAAIARVFARPQEAPDMTLRRRQYRLRRRTERQIHTQVHDEQTVFVVTSRGEEAQDEGLETQHRAIEAARARRAEDGVCTAQAQEVAVQRITLGVTMPLREVQLRTSKGLDVARVGQAGLRLRRREAGKLREKLRTTLLHTARERPLVICEIEEGRGRGEFLPLKQQRRGRPHQQQRRHRTIAAGAGELMDALAAPGDGDLIMVLDEGNIARVRLIEGRCAPPLVLPLIALPLIALAPLHGGDEFLRPTV